MEARNDMSCSHPTRKIGIDRSYFPKLKDKEAFGIILTLILAIVPVNGNIVVEVVWYLDDCVPAV
jgi:hypothetical protein